MVKVSVNRYVQQRIVKTKKETEANMEKLRKTILKNLEEIFSVAGKIVKGEIKYQRVNGKMTRITLPQRRKWLQLAKQTAETIQTITANLNEKEIKAKLEELEKLVNELQTNTYP